MSAAAKWFVKLVFTLLVPPVAVPGVGYAQYGWSGAIEGGIVGLLAGLTGAGNR
jgi:hypothetical protein